MPLERFTHDRVDAAATAALYDWTEGLPQTDHVRFFRNVDWSRTELGPLSHWGTALRMYTHMVMSDSRAATLYWGPNQVAIYNEHFAPLAAGTHPRLMGQTFAFGFPELVPFIKPLFEEATRSGVAQDVVEAPMMVERSGYTEEAFFTGNFTPIRGTEGEIEGFYNALFEVTLQKIYDRRTKLLNLVAATPGQLTIREVYSHILTSLEDDPNDVPMAILYEADAVSEPGKTILRLRGQIGVPKGHGLLRDGQDLENEDDIVSIYRRAKSGRVITAVDERFDGLQWLGFQQATDKVVTFALATGVRRFGFLTVGTNPYRRFDDTCEQFIKDLTRVASGVIASAWDSENLRKKQEQLQIELEFSDLKVRHLVQHASVGMAHAKSDGRIMWANEKFLSLSDVTTETHGVLGSIYEVFLDEDRPKAERVWARIMDGDNHVSAELRLNRLFVPPVGDPEPAHVQILAFPYKEHGITISAMACTTEISRLKWAEAWQTRVAEDAREAKRQQEQFIDMVSHEMRNPLSAIVHCADTISATINDLQLNFDIKVIPGPVLDALRENVSDAEVILDCARYQKRIIDDILTLGRLESTLLSVKPSAVKPSELIDSLLSLFEAELRSNMITTKVTAEPSMQGLGINHLYLDPSRVTQIFMNMLTNAIKFVKNENTRNIEIRYGATLSPPRSTKGINLLSKDLCWAPKGKNATDVTNDSEWGTGEIVYLIFSLSDTGIGIHETEILKIFERFQQASIRTHMTYGGSGLGLYISKELTEKMAGEIGVSSRLGEGSRFVFYIKTRRAEVKLGYLPLRTVTTAPLPTTLTRELCVLLVEDNLINQKVLQKHLTKAQCHVVIANHGLEALDLLRKPGAYFDIVLMDVQMPVMDGLTCMTEIRRLEKMATLKGRLPIIAVTANVRQEQVDTVLAAGADRVIRKPFKAADLIALMRELTVDTLSKQGEEARPDSSVDEHH
ncbi:putative histidine kinase-like protein M3YPp [Pyrenochaeta sp. MPI-SDFR-AT-0127]|nr:putative histidine kinase-like protein M3YPp [Pyrenochaeta sp. MPI-SDFR-AT-0127]